MLQPDNRPVSGWTGEPTERGHFRPDIEGLRAVAVVAVLLFHAGVPGFGGGFVGVDVFYVISGFLITGLLRRELLASGRIELASFYARRARRLLPAALVVIAVTVAASALILSRFRSSEVAMDGAWAALYIVNYRFAFEQLDYLTDTTQSPLLHFWSLAVEEQFYLFWPPLVLVAARLAGVRRLGWLVLAIGVPSFVLAFVLTYTNAPMAFYSLPTRAWELALGAILALRPAHDSRWLPKRALPWLPWIGLLLIVGASVGIDPANGYPGAWALIPTVGAAMVIAGGPAGGGAALLSRPLPRWLGRISYSLYLWHWPLLILVPPIIGDDGPAVRLPLALLAVAIAHLSTRWIEQPFRGSASRGRRTRTALLLAGAMSVVLAVGSVGAAAVLRPRVQPTVSQDQLQQDMRNPLAVLAHPWTSGPLPQELHAGLGWAANDVPVSRLDNCQTDRLGIEPITCVYGDLASSDDVVVIGDSHAAQWLAALDDLGAARDWRVVSFIKVGCPPIDAATWSDQLDRPYEECALWRAEALDEIDRLQPEMVIVSSARHHVVVGADGERFEHAQRPGEWEAAIARTLRRLGAASERVVLLADTPANARDPIDCLASGRRFEDCQSPTAIAADAAYTATEAAAAVDGAATFVSMNDIICGPQVCPLAFGDYLVYRDSGHLTATFTRLLSGVLGSRLPDL